MARRLELDVEGVDVVVAPEGRREQDAERDEAGAVGVERLPRRRRRVAELLRRAVARRHGAPPRVVARPRRDVHGAAEVDEREAPRTRRHEDVRRLDVPVRDAAAVDARERLRQEGQHAARDGQIRRAAPRGLRVRHRAALVPINGALVLEGARVEAQRRRERVDAAGPVLDVARRVPPAADPLEDEVLAGLGLEEARVRRAADRGADVAREALDVPELLVDQPLRREVLPRQVVPLRPLRDELAPTLVRRRHHDAVAPLADDPRLVHDDTRRLAPRAAAQQPTAQLLDARRDAREHQPADRRHCKAEEDPAGHHASGLRQRRSPARPASARSTSSPAQTPPSPRSRKVAGLEAHSWLGRPRGVRRPRRGRPASSASGRARARR